MQKIFRFFLASSRRRRLRSIGAAMWLLRLVRDAEHDDMRTNEDMLEGFASGDERVFTRKIYNDIEEECLACEHAMGFLESAIDDLEFVY